MWELVHDASVFGREQNEGDTEDPESRLRVLAGFLEHCRSMRTASESLGDEARVTLSTLHRAKGLEFDTVIIAGFSAEHLPSRGAVNTTNGNEEAVVEEERRLADVGMTRARTELYLSVPELSGRGRRQRPTQPSPFLDEIPAGLKNESTRAEGTPETKDETGRDPETRGHHGTVRS